eukprot:3831215-Pyramimonas_sp.AAC.1
MHAFLRFGGAVPLEPSIQTIALDRQDTSDGEPSSLRLLEGRSLEFRSAHVGRARAPHYVLHAHSP